ncbi:MAG: hypothetical protein ABIO98_05920, partial [Chitinophagales bacterium]
MKKLFIHHVIFHIFILLFWCSSSVATVFDVNSLASTNSGSGTSGTLRYCISQANLSVGPHSINFSVAGTISINSSGALLPILTKQIVINATTAPGYSGSPAIILDGT